MLLRGQLVAETPIYRGNARKTLFTRDGDGSQRLVSLAGEISGTAQALMDAFVGQSRDGRNIGLLNRLWLRLYGSPLPAGLVTRVECQLQKESYPRDHFFDLRMGLRLDEDRWASEANANYKMETLFKNAVFDLALTVNDAALQKEDNAARLYYTLQELREGRLAQVWILRAPALAKLGKGKFPLSQKALDAVQPLCDQPFASPSDAEAALKTALPIVRLGGRRSKPGDHGTPRVQLRRVCRARAGVVQGSVSVHRLEFCEPPMDAPSRARRADVPDRPDLAIVSPRAARAHRQAAGRFPTRYRAGELLAGGPAGRARFTIQFWNLGEQELQRLIWCVVLEPKLAHKLGKHRHVGFGSLRLQILPDSFLIDWGERYASQSGKGICLSRSTTGSSRRSSPIMPNCKPR